MFCYSLFVDPLIVIPCTAYTWVVFRVGKCLNAASCDIHGVGRF